MGQSLNTDLYARFYGELSTLYPDGPREHLSAVGILPELPAAIAVQLDRYTGGKINVFEISEAVATAMAITAAFINLGVSDE